MDEIVSLPTTISTDPFVLLDTLIYFQKLDPIHCFSVFLSSWSLLVGSLPPSSQASLHSCIVSVMSALLSKASATNDYALEIKILANRDSLFLIPFEKIFNKNQLPSIMILVKRFESSGTILPLIKNHELGSLSSLFNNLLTNEILDHYLIEMNQKTEKEKMNHDDSFLFEISELVSKLFKDARIELFGSRVTQIGDAESDVDVIIQFGADFMHESHTLFCLPGPDINKCENTNATDVDVLQTLCDLLRESGFSKKQSILVKGVRVSVLKLTHRLTGKRVDITARRGIEQRVKTLFLRDCFALHPCIIPFMRAVKFWVKRRKLNDASCGCMNSFGWTLCALFHISQRGYVNFSFEKRIAAIRHVFENPIPINSLPVLENNVSQNILSTDLGFCLCSFFHFLAFEMLYKEQSISVITNSFLPSMRLLNLSSDKKDQLHCFCVQDIIDPEDNVARGVRKCNAIVLAEECARAYSLLVSGAPFFTRVCEQK